MITNKVIEQKEIKLPESFRGWFWDCKFNELDPVEYKEYVVDRLLEKGRIEQLKWMFTNYGNNLIKSRIQDSSNLSDKTKLFWEIYFYETSH